MTDIPETSVLCTPTDAVIQVHRDVNYGQIAVADRTAERTASFVVLPNGSATISCPLNYFQQSASLPGSWIQDDAGKRLPLRHIGDLSSVVVSVLSDGREFASGLPETMQRNLLRYFMLDVVHNEQSYVGFDCYAFVSLVADVDFRPEVPPFDYEESDAHAGDIVAIATDSRLPESIKHWAICVGDDLYLSKFGKSGEGAKSLVSVTNEEAMITLFDCCVSLTTRTRPNVDSFDIEGWKGFAK